MCDTVGVKIIESGSDLMGKLFGALLGDGERALLQVAEEVTSIQLLHDNVDVVLVFEYIQEANNVWMLAHLQNLNFTPLQFNILNGHLLLGHDLDSDRLARLLVDGGLDEAEFTLS